MKPNDLASQLRDIGKIYNIRRGNGTDIDARRIANVTWKLLLGYSWDREKLEFSDDLINSIERDTRKFGRPEYSLYQIAQMWKLQSSPLQVEDERRGAAIDPLKLIKVDDIPLENIQEFYREIIKRIVGEKDEKYGINRTNLSRVRSDKSIRSISGKNRSNRKKR